MFLGHQSILCIIKFSQDLISTFALSLLDENYRLTRVCFSFFRVTTVLLVKYPSQYNTQKRPRQGKSATVLIIEILPAVYSTRQAFEIRFPAQTPSRASYAEVFIILERLDLGETSICSNWLAAESLGSSPDLQLISMQMIFTFFQTEQRTTITLKHEVGENKSRA